MMIFVVDILFYTTRTSERYKVRKREKDMSPPRGLRDLGIICNDKTSPNVQEFLKSLSVNPFFSVKFIHPEVERIRISIHDLA